MSTAADGALTEQRLCAECHVQHETCTTCGEALAWSPRWRRYFLSHGAAPHYCQPVLLWEQERECLCGQLIIEREDGARFRNGVSHTCPVPAEPSPSRLPRTVAPPLPQGRRPVWEAFGE